MEQQHDATILKRLSSQPLGYRELMRKCGIADRPLRRRVKWLTKNGYVSRAKGHWKLGRTILHSITKRGTAYYKEIRDVAAIQHAALTLGDWSVANDDDRTADVSLELFLSLFRLTYNRFHEMDNPKTYDDFMTRTELSVQNYLNERLTSQDAGNRNGPMKVPYREFYMAIIRRPSEALREDGKLAYELGHGLTRCHVDLLCDQLKLFDKEALLSRNESWLETRKALDIREELQKEFAQRCMRLKHMYPGAFDTKFGLDHPGKRGLELALANSEKSDSTQPSSRSHLARQAS
jgi:DNA-binding HxlR family transcriptional regulator